MDKQYCVTRNVLLDIEPPKTGILSQTLFNDEHTKIIAFGFAAGQELTAHTAPMPATIQILSGEGTLALGSDSCQVSQGCLVHMQPDLLHGVLARTPLRMLLTLHKAARQDADKSAA